MKNLHFSWEHPHTSTMSLLSFPSSQCSSFPESHHLQMGDVEHAGMPTVAGGASHMNYGQPMCLKPCRNRFSGCRNSQSWLLWLRLQNKCPQVSCAYTILSVLFSCSSLWLFLNHWESQCFCGFHGFTQGHFWLSIWLRAYPRIFELERAPLMIVFSVCLIFFLGHTISPYS